MTTISNGRFETRILRQLHAYRQAAGKPRPVSRSRALTLAEYLSKLWRVELLELAGRCDLAAFYHRKGRVMTTLLVASGPFPLV